MYVCARAYVSVSLSHRRSWTLYRSQSSTGVHQTCYQEDVLTYSFLVEIWNITVRQTGSGINHYHYSYDPTAFIYELDPYCLETYRMYENEHRTGTSMLSKVIVLKGGEYVHLVARVHFRSCDKDGGHTIGSAVVEKTTQTWWLYHL